MTENAIAWRENAGGVKKPFVEQRELEGPQNFSDWGGEGGLRGATGKEQAEKEEKTSAGKSWPQEPGEGGHFSRWPQLGEMGHREQPLEQTARLSWQPLQWRFARTVAKPR